MHVNAVFMRDRNAAPPRQARRTHAHHPEDKSFIICILRRTS